MVEDKRKAFADADAAWSRELHRLFDRRAGDVRYTPRGKGEPDSELRRLYDAREAARVAWDESRGIGPDGLKINRE